MAAKRNRLTVVATKEVEELLSKAQKTRFCGRARSDMLRELVTAGLDSREKKNEGKKWIPKP